MEQPFLETNLPNLPLLARGKVRDLYHLGDQLLIIATAEGPALVDRETEEVVESSGYQGGAWPEALRWRMYNPLTGEA